MHMHCLVNAKSMAATLHNHQKPPQDHPQIQHQLRHFYSFIPSTIRRYRNQRHLTLENVSGIAGMSVQHLSEIESSKRDPRLSSIERIADAMAHVFQGLGRRRGA